MNRASEPYQKLSLFAGTWLGKDTIQSTPFAPAGQATTKYSGKLDLNGLFVIGDDVQERTDGTYLAHKVFGWDSKKQSYTFYLFDSIGQSPDTPGLGQWMNNTIAFEQVGALGPVRYTYTFEDAGNYQFKMEFSPNGDSWTTFIEGYYVKQPE